MLALTCGCMGYTYCKIHGGWRRKKAIRGHNRKRVEAELRGTVSGMMNVSFAPAGRLSPARRTRIE